DSGANDSNISLRLDARVEKNSRRGQAGGPANRAANLPFLLARRGVGQVRVEPVDMRADVRDGVVDGFADGVAFLLAIDTFDPLPGRAVVIGAVVGPAAELAGQYVIRKVLAAGTHALNREVVRPVRLRGGRGDLLEALDPCLARFAAGLQRKEHDVHEERL